MLRARVEAQRGDGYCTAGGGAAATVPRPTKYERVSPDTIRRTLTIGCIQPPNLALTGAAIVTRPYGDALLSP